MSFLNSLLCSIITQSLLSALPVVLLLTTVPASVIMNAHVKNIQ